MAKKIAFGSTHVVIDLPYGNTLKVTHLKDAEILKGKFDFKPKAIIERLGLRQPIFRQTATYGHFGKRGLPWEEIIEL